MTTRINEGPTKFWKAFHDSDRFALHATIYTWAAEMIPPGLVLDLGCEYGFGSLLVTETNPQVRVLAIDNEFPVLRYALKIHGNRPIRRVNADAMNLPMPCDSFIGIYLINLLHLVDEPGNALSEVKRVLKPGGMAVISIPEETFFRSGQSRPRLIRQLEVEINRQFSNVTYPKKICGRMPSFPSRVFSIRPEVSTWIALCWKGQLVDKNNSI